MRLRERVAALARLAVVAGLLASASAVQVWSDSVSTGAAQPVIVFSHGFLGCATQSRFLSDFVRGRPKQPVDAFIQESNAVMAHDAEGQLGKIRAPTQITFGRHDLLTIRFADRLTDGIKNSELHIFEDCSHAPLYENVPAFNEKTLAFLKKHAD